MFTHTGPRRGSVFVVSNFAKQIAAIEAGLKKPVVEVGNLDSIRTFTDVRDAVHAYWLLVTKCPPGEVYNIGANQLPELTNLDVTRTILDELEKPEKRIKHVKGIRPGHDQRYAVKTEKIRDTGWRPKIPFEVGIKRTIQWYVDNKDWWMRLKSKS